MKTCPPVLIVSAMFLFLVACDNEATVAKEHTYDVQYYIGHVKERKEKLAECGNNPGELSSTANCINASAAMNKSIFDPNNSEMPKIR